MKICFGTKAETLERLSGRLMSCRVLSQVRFSVAEWRNSDRDVIQRVRDSGLLADAMIVRSSALAEDGPGCSLAGRFLSVPGVEGVDGLRDAVSRVIKSFDDNRVNNQVFVQPMLRNVALSGVAFSKDPNTGAPYRVINYDDHSGTTDTVTAGHSDGLKVFYCCEAATAPIPAGLAPVIAMISELEEALEANALDIEFAVCEKGEIYLLQVRPLEGNFGHPIPVHTHRAALGQIREKLQSMMRPHPYLHGPRTVFGVMPDWNPAEIIGVRPRPLALSLYKDLITDNIWAYQRDNYGYKNLRSFPLVLNICGLPYVDVRVSFNSFVPRDVDPELSERLVLLC